MEHKYFSSYFSVKSLKAMGLLAGFTSLAFLLGIGTAGEVRPISASLADDARLEGDIDGDNDVDVTDARIILEIVRGYRSPTRNELLADPNQDFRITIDDALAILKRIE